MEQPTRTILAALAGLLVLWKAQIYQKFYCSGIDPIAFISCF